MKHMLDQYIVRTNDDDKCKVDKVYTYTDEENYPDTIET